MKKIIDKNFYKNQINEYNFSAQKHLLLNLTVFLFLYCLLLNILEFFLTGEYHKKTISLLICLSILLILWLVHKIYSEIVLKYINVIAYLNILIILSAIQIYYHQQNYQASYIVYTCIMLSTGISVIGNTFKYASIIAPILIIDVIVNVVEFDGGMTYDLLIYVLENLIILLFCIIINRYFTLLKYKVFKKETEIIELCNTDPLTGLLNRRAAERYVQEYSKVDGLHCMIILDLDNFKLLNDILGHQKGDECLITVSKKIKETFRSTDCISRLGGDEFMIFMPQILNEECAIDKCEDLLKKLQIKYNYNNQEILISASIGITFCKKSCMNLYDKLYSEADSAMYMSKKNGKNCFLRYVSSGS